MEKNTDKIYSVSEINYHVKEIIEYSFDNYIMVEGEISQMNVAQSGHIYITLKDKNSTVRCTLWSTRVSKMQIYPEIGLKAIVKCKVSFYEKNGSYQLDLIGIKSASTGEFHEIFEKLKLKLKEEGLFESKFKQELPKYPNSISIITSLTGSVIQDILKIIERRLPNANIDIYACSVQGNKCSKSIIKQLITINKKNIADIIIIARGGGSLEDLIEYNDEFLARQIYNSRIPIVTAIGHETDTTIADLVSDVRAATPSEAAEIISKISIQDMLIFLKEQTRISENNLNNILKNYKYSLSNSKNTIENCNPENKLNNFSQTIDTYTEALKSKILSNLIKNKEIINSKNNSITLLNPKNKITELESKILRQKESINNSLDKILNCYKNSLVIKNNTINNINPLSILNKGYSIVYKDNKVVNSASSFNINDDIKIKVIDGDIFSKITKIKKN